MNRSPNSSTKSSIFEEIPSFSSIDYDGDDPPLNINWGNPPKLTPEEAMSIDNPCHDQKIDINMYEQQGKPIQQVYQSWLNGAGINLNNQIEKDLESGKLEKDEKDDGTFDLIWNKLEPRIKWFRPPLSINIFKLKISMMWVYKIVKSTLFTGCYSNIIFNKECDLLEGNRPENDSDTQYSSCNQCHRYEICKKYYYNKKEDK